MKPSLKTGLSVKREVTVDAERCIGFMGKEGAVYATPRMVSDVEYTCRDYLLQHLDEGEDSVGAHVSIDHLAATPMGLKVSVEATIVEVDRRRVTFEFTVHDPVEPRDPAREVRRLDALLHTREKSVHSLEVGVLRGAAAQFDASLLAGRDERDRQVAVDVRVHAGQRELQRRNATTRARREERRSCVTRSALSPALISALTVALSRPAIEGVFVDQQYAVFLSRRACHAFFTR
jgi:predicted thioesterase